MPEVDATAWFQYKFNESELLGSKSRRKDLGLGRDTLAAQGSHAPVDFFSIMLWRSSHPNRKRVHEDLINNKIRSKGVPKARYSILRTDNLGYIFLRELLYKELRAVHSSPLAAGRLAKLLDI